MEPIAAATVGESDEPPLRWKRLLLADSTPGSVPAINQKIIIVYKSEIDSNYIVSG